MHRFLLSFPLWLAVSAVGHSVRAEPPWTVREHIPPGEFIVQAHRGAGELAEENTIEAFELGWSLGCIPEADVRTTKDGVIVPFHDATFARVVRGVDAETAKKGVGDVTFEELSKLDVGAWKGERFSGRRVGPLRDVFAAMGSDPARRLYLDIKQVDLPQLAKEAAEAGVASRVILASTNYPLIRRWKALSPESKTLLWMGGSEDALLRRFEELRATDFADVDQLQIHTNLARPVAEIRRDSRDPFKESDAFLIARGEELRRHGVLYQTLPWGGSTPDVYAKLLDLGFMSFATDHPKATWEAVRRYYQVD
ncbi:glycerophosphodiester phosphodiesterase [Planctomyces sp. SH-PL62]|uniref:glycerophosphodiester phosphodiesterase n=1 Tax=Planctomyces sp. SH-PL62 TaxID=1636152 RepID=UPI00078C7992|nr:glycerophosphodiester phosphodiesterase family protein [Planctomyces sp. SH-PL62]AMV38616.1 Glycerophosphoryl diester phosphodiesterase [Planctomyces sp. SH-PL62]